MSSTISRSKDHPRVCGEKPDDPRGHRDALGSPPRVRGEVSKQELMKLKEGITPACAGRSCPVFSPIPAGRDHPRVCGEKLSRFIGLPAGEGSPPRVRGEVSVSSPFPPSCGITPACAGRSSVSADTTGQRRDHPRVCGEKGTFRLYSSVREGSPPRVRGEDQSFRFVLPSPGITPACAGRRIFRMNISAALRGSPPRVRGEESRSV